MKTSALALLGGATTALAAVRGFNYASQGQNQGSFESQFQTAAGLVGADDFTSARLYTMIQDGSTNTPISAIPAAIASNTTLLLGLWASVPQDGFDNEITALKNAIQQYGSAFADLVVGISVGSEDLYRVSPTGIENLSGVGQSPDVLVDYIGQVRDAIQGTSLSSKLVGHVDTWNAFVNGSNSAVISASDFLGLDEYPYYQTTDSNSIDNAGTLFFQAYDRVAAVAGGKPIWVTESGWPVSGPVSNLATASVDNAETFWQTVACELEHRGVDFWWYILADGGASPSFGVSSNGQPLYNLACNATSGSNTTSSTSSATGVSASTTTATGYQNSTISASGSVTSGASIVSAVGGPSITPPGSAGSAGSTGALSFGTATPTSGGSSGGSASASASGSQFTGAGSKLEGSIAGLVIGAAVAVFAL